MTEVTNEGGRKQNQQARREYSSNSLDGSGSPFPRIVERQNRPLIAALRTIELDFINRLDWGSLT